MLEARIVSISMLMLESIGGGGSSSVLENLTQTQAPHYTIFIAPSSSIWNDIRRVAGFHVQLHQIRKCLTHDIYSAD